MRIPTVGFRERWPRAYTRLVRYAAWLGFGVLLGSPLAAQDDGCFSTDCFFSGRVREFQIVDRDTLVVYTGNDRCAFIVTVDSLFCDLTFLPEVEFFRTSDAIIRESAGRPIADAYGRNDRICPNNATQYSLETFGFASTEDDQTPRGRPACEIQVVTPASDNDLIELLTLERIAPPPPPIGNGEITRSGSDEAQEDARE